MGWSIEILSLPLRMEKDTAWKKKKERSGYRDR
jgi:hypothetical protein